MFDKIKEEYNLTCTEIEFNTYKNAIDLTETINQLELLQPIVKPFTELYNWVEVENPANWEVYYNLEVEWKVFLQNIIPYIWWLNPITLLNIDEVVNKHKEQLIKEYTDWLRYQMTIENFKTI